MSVWTLVLCDLQGRPVGELRNAKNRTLSFALNGTPTGGFHLRCDHPFAADVLTTDVLVKAYEDATLKGVYEVASAEEVVQGSAEDGIAITIAGPWSRMDKRLVGKSETGYSAGPLDRGLIAQAMIAAANAEDYTGIDIGTIEASASDTVGPWYFKSIAEANGELASALDGYDWDVTPVEPVMDFTTPPAPPVPGIPSSWPTVDDQGQGSGFPQAPIGQNPATPDPNPTANSKPTIGEFNAYSVKGFFRANAVFEYGTGRHNVKSFRRPVDRTKMLNRGWSLPQGFPDVQVASTIISSEDPDSIAARGLAEGVVASDLVVDEMRQLLVTEHVRIRSEPRQLILFESHISDPERPGRVPVFGVDYDVGDVVPARAVVNGSVRFDALLRIYGVDLAITDEGIAVPTLRLVTS